MLSPHSIHSLIATQAIQQPNAIALQAPGQSSLTYLQLHDQISRIAHCLQAFGIGRNDRVAVVLPNGADMAVTFLAVTAIAICAPLNPGYRAPEFEFYLADLSAKAVIVAIDLDSPVRQVAQAHQIPIIDLVGSTDIAGRFKLHNLTLPTSPLDLAELEDVALILHTSGTTSRPKMVPLTHLNLVTSAAAIGQTLALRTSDCCLNVMPLFHIHGLVAALLASLAAGGSVVCTPGFQGSHFWAWVSSFQPTWYTAVPTMHQAILEQAKDHPGAIHEANPAGVATHSLRLIRSSSAALPPQVLAALETLLRVPVIEAYGMTEAAHQMASNPLPPQVHKPGSVGQAAGPEIAIMDAEGHLLPQGEQGEVVIRGRNVTQGYVHNPEANAGAFTEGWFRTGDQGYFDADNYLYLTGRLKEQINRGGRKIAPLEIDLALMELPQVHQAVAFASPHPTLGEDVDVAIVLKPGQLLTESTVRSFLFQQLADYKVPSRIIFVADIPKGPTGKLQRVGLHERLSADLKSQFVAARTAVEQTLVNIWAQVLRQDTISVTDNFFALGGDSLQAVTLFAQIQSRLHRDLPLVTLVKAPTIEQLAAVIQQSDRDEPVTSLVALQATGTKPALFFHGGSADAVTWSRFAELLGSDQPFYALQRPDLDGRMSLDNTVECLARHCIQDIQKIQPQGPYVLGGHCFGGTVAWEIAQQLRAQGQTVTTLILIDAYAPGKPSSPWINQGLAKLQPALFWLQKSYYYHGGTQGLTKLMRRSTRMVQRGVAIATSKLKLRSQSTQSPDATHPHSLANPPRTDERQPEAQFPQAVLPESISPAPIPAPIPYELRYARSEELSRIAAACYTPQPYPDRVILLRATNQPRSWIVGQALGWQTLAQNLTMRMIPGFFGNLFNQASGPLLAAQVQQDLGTGTES